MSVRRLPRKRRPQALSALSAWIARTTETMPASGYSNVNTSAAFLVPQIIHATRNVLRRADNVAVIANAKSLAGNPARLVWNHVNGAVPTSLVRLYAAR